MSDFTDLTLYETRILGALIEKAITTPDQYPLSLNALTNACNQKSNREPVLDLEEATVQETVDGLVKRRLVTEVIGYGSRARAAKYQHRFCNTEFSALRFSAQELGIICVLFLRGPQTPGELRSRTSRLCKFEDVQEVEAVLEGLIANSSGPFVVQLPRESGKRENRYAHLFSGEVRVADTWPAEAPGTGQLPGGGSDRLAALEQRLEAMQAEIDELRGLVDELYS